MKLAGQLVDLLVGWLVSQLIGQPAAFKFAYDPNHELNIMITYTQKPGSEQQACSVLTLPQLSKQFSEKDSK